MIVSTTGEVALICAACGTTYPLDSLAWRCGCGGLLDITGFTPVMPDVTTLRSRPATLWRYAEALPLTAPEGVAMGEGMTPLITTPQAPGIGLKADHMMPTGSFKDRGAVMLVGLAARLGVTRMIADSSGNAGTAIAAYAARAGITCRVYIPAATSSGKIAQLRAYGAEVTQVVGSREDTADAARQAAGEPSVFYASHVYHPLFLHGTKTYALELWEQFGGRLPQTLVLPVGNGTLLLGAYLGCKDLLSLRLIDRMPVIVGVQSAACAPLAAALAGGLDTPGDVTARPTIAEGIAIARPARGAQILTAIRDTGGTILTVTDDQIRAAHADLARAGIYVEPTAAACWAAITSGGIRPAPATAVHPHTVVPLCGSGLKSKPPGRLQSTVLASMVVPTGKDQQWEP